MPLNSTDNKTHAERDSNVTPSPFSAWFLGGAIGVAAILILRRLSDDSVGYPDADRILMDGVFLLDFFTDLPLNRIYDYTIAYYAQYPALSIGYRPPFFPLIESLFNFALGTSPSSSRLALFAMFAAGCVAWYRFIERNYDTPTAAGAVFLLVTAPFLVQWGWYTMAELPVLGMAMLTIPGFARYVDTGSNRHACLSALLLVATVWTKQTGLVLFPVLALMAVFSGKLRQLMSRRSALYFALIVVAGVAPLAAVMIWLGDQNIAQSIGACDSHRESLSHGPWLFQYGLTTLVKHHLSGPLLGFFVVGIIVALASRDAHCTSFAFLFLSTLVCAGLLEVQESRYFLLWMPGIAGIAAVPVYYARRRSAVRYCLLSVIAASCVFHCNRVFDMPLQFAEGYKEAARYILANSNSPMVFFDGYRNGYFIYFMRQLDERKSMYVLRGDKLLSSSSINPYNLLELHASDARDIAHIFARYGPEYIVVESEDTTNINIHRVLRKYLRKGPFTLEHTIPIESNLKRFESAALLIYRRDEWQLPVGKTIDLRLPVVGKTLRVPLRDALSRRVIDTRN